MIPLIEVEALKKEYKVYEKKPGFLGIIKNLVNPKVKLVQAVNDINFEIKTGEFIGLIGPNGAGKSTTIKMMTGVLEPSGGSIKVFGQTPTLKRKINAYKIGVVFGHKSQLWWNLPVLESFELVKSIYNIDSNLYKKNFNLFCDLLEISDFLNTPVRQLSLGQRMRVELAVSLIHEPQLLLLDEPTIGLDIIAKHQIRNFLKDINKTKKTSIILTTHDMNDVEKLCERILIIDRGKILYDGNLSRIREKLGNERILIIDFDDKVDDFNISIGSVIEQNPYQVKVQFNKNHTSAISIINEISNKYPVKDIIIKETEIDDLIKKVYKHEF